MSSIVKELQIDSMNSDSMLSDLLRKALFVAKKLKIKEFEDWINMELNGYHGEEIPAYRHVKGSLKYFNPVYGNFFDYNIPHAGINDSLSIVRLRAPIAELEDLSENSENKPLVHEILPEIQSHFAKSFQVDPPEKVFISPSALMGVLDNIRNIVFEWSMKLEDDGILGEDFNFNEEEEKIAHQQSNVYNTMISGSSNIQVGEANIQNITEIDLEEVKGILTLIKSSIESFGLNETDEDTIKGELVAMDSQFDSPNPNPNLLKESLRSIRSVLENVASNAIVTILLPHITKIIGF